MRPRYAFSIAILLSLLFASCTSPLASVTGNSDTGTLSVSAAGRETDGQIGASTVFPDIDREFLVYRFRLRNDDAGQDLTGIAGDAAQEFTDLIPGAWTVEVVAAVGPAAEADWDVPVLAGQTPVQIRAGERVQIVVLMQVADSGRGGLDILVSWPEDEVVAALEYRLDADGSADEWARVSSSFFLTMDGATSAAVSLRDLLPGDYILTIRLDAGESRELRYRAHAEEVVHIAPGVVTEAGFVLSAGEFSRVPIAPGTWEFFEQEGQIIINPDGSIQFTDSGYRYVMNEQFISVDPDTYAISFDGSGEKRLFAEMPDVSRIRVEIRGAFIAGSNGGWGLFFHAEEPGGGQDVAGWTLQVDRGLGDQVVLRQWTRGRERDPFLRIAQAAHGIDWTEPLDVNVDIDGFALRVELVQAGATTVIIDEANLSTMPNVVAGQARDSGFLGLRSWADAPVTIDELRLILPN
ncbi:MAG: hypothetical protein EA383_17530 [Spirochaetaceae bacterium]|nr:MAG: hypothetical protein EA383_17530 [Spirochaetaceae bacterium]